MKGLNRFCIPRGNNNIKVLCKWTKKMDKGTRKEYHDRSQEGLGWRLDVASLQERDFQG